jgi:hypothetical protein
MPGKLDIFQAIVGGLKSYDDAKAKGQEDMATQAYQEVMAGINALSGITGVRSDIQRMRLERAEETQREAMRPLELRREEAAVEQAETTAESMQMQIEEQRKTIDALRARLKEAGLPETMEAAKELEPIAEIIASQKARRAEAKVGAEVLGYNLEQLADWVEMRMRAEELRKGLPEQRVSAEAVELATREKRAGYEQLVIDWQTKEGVPEAEAHSRAVIASRTLEQADANIKLAKRNARLAKTQADRLEAQMDADRLQHDTLAEAGLDLGKLMVAKAKIAAKLLPSANDTLDNLRDALHIWTTLKSQPAGRIDPLEIAMAERMPSVRDLIQQILPSPMERQEAIDAVANHINLQKQLLMEIGIDYDSFAEEAMRYDKSDLEGIRKDLGVESEIVPGGLYGQDVKALTDAMDTVSLRLLNKPDLERQDVLEMINQNRTEGSNLEAMFGGGNVDVMYRVLSRLQDVNAP